MAPDRTQGRAPATQPVCCQSTCRVHTMIHDPGFKKDAATQTVERKREHFWGVRVCVCDFVASSIDSLFYPNITSDRHTHADNERDSLNQTHPPGPTDLKSPEGRGAPIAPLKPTKSRLGGGGGPPAHGQNRTPRSLWQRPRTTSGPRQERPFPSECHSTLAASSP